ARALPSAPTTAAIRIMRSSSGNVMVMGVPLSGPFDCKPRAGSASCKSLETLLREAEQIALPTVLQTRNSSKGRVHFSATFGSVPERIQRRSIFARGPMSTLPRHAAGVRIALAIAMLSAEVLPSAAQEIIVDKRSARARAERVAEEVRPAVLFRKRADSLV